MAESGTGTGRFWRRLDRQAVAGPILAFPGTLGLLLFIAIPFATAVALSFTDLRMGSPLPTEFVGHRQYHRILTDGSFQRALLNNTLTKVVFTPGGSRDLPSLTTIMNGLSKEGDVSASTA